MELLKSLYPAAVGIGIGYILTWIRRRGDRGRRVADSLTVTMIVAAVLALAIWGKPFSGWVLLATGVAMGVAAIVRLLVSRGETRTDPGGESPTSGALGS
jgi:peptidoglycan/LPS O-acetylase OafA/YrhL